MNPEQQRIELAKLDGWSPDDGWNRTWTHKNGPAGVAIPTEHLPDYLNDLNVVYELEKKLFDNDSIDERSLWYDMLAVCCMWRYAGNAPDLSFEASYAIARATAAQRCEAILRVKRIWK